MRWLLRRLAWTGLMLIGITFVTFAVIDLAPVDRAELEVARAAPERAFVDRSSRDAAVMRLRVQHGMVDPVTFEPVPVWRRYGNWLLAATTLQFGGPGDDRAALWRRIGAALPPTLLVGGLAMLLAFGVGVPLGVWLGMRAGSRADRLVSTGMLAVGSVPEFLAATLLLLAFASAWLHWLPIAGLATAGAESWSLPARLLDFGAHLVLPVGVMAMGPMVMVSRFVREAAARACKAPFAQAMQALGIDETTRHRRLLRHAAVPAATLVGSLVPMLTGGSIVVENLFALDGLGHLAFSAAAEHDQPMVMATVVIGSVVTMLGFLVSDLLHRVVDPRVELS